MAQSASGGRIRLFYSKPPGAAEPGRPENSAPHLAARQNPLDPFELTTPNDSAIPPGAGSGANLPGPLSLRRIGTAHLAIGLVAVLCVTGAVDLWPAVRAGGQPLEIDSPAQRAVWAALAYLVVTALVELRASFAVAAGQAASSAFTSRAIGAHLLVLAASAVTIARGFHSLALLAGLHVILSALVTVSLIVSVVDYWEQRALRLEGGEAQSSGKGSTPAPAAGLGAIWLVPLWGAALLVVGTLFYLEEQPVPHAEMPAIESAPDESSADDTPAATPQN